MLGMFVLGEINSQKPNHHPLKSKQQATLVLDAIYNTLFNLFLLYFCL
jgi:hypothetical protein